eukprot:129431_1
MQGSFWTTSFGAMYSSATSPIDDLLESDECTLEKLLDEDEVIQECNALNAGLVEFLSSAESIRKIIAYITVFPAEDDDEKRKLKFPYVCCELLASAVVPMLDTLVNPECELLEHLFSFLDTEREGDAAKGGISKGDSTNGDTLKDDTAKDITTANGDTEGGAAKGLECRASSAEGVKPLDSVLAGYFRIAVSVLIQRKHAELIQFIKEHSYIVDHIIRHIGTHSIMELLIMLGWDDGSEQDHVWLYQLDVIPKLVANLASLDENVNTSASYALVDVVAKCHSTETSLLLGHLQTRPMVEEIANHIFSGNESSLISGMSVLIALVHRNANAIAAREAQYQMAAEAEEASSVDAKEAGTKWELGTEQSAELELDAAELPAGPHIDSDSSSDSDVDISSDSSSSSSDSPKLSLVDTEESSHSNANETGDEMSISEPAPSEQSQSSGQQSTAAADENSPSEDHQPVSSEEQSEESEVQLPPSPEEASPSPEQLTPSSEQSVSGEEESAPDGVQPTASEEQPTANEQSSTLITSEQQTSSSVNQPATPVEQQPAPSEEHPATSGEQPAPTDQPSAPTRVTSSSSYASTVDSEPITEPSQLPTVIQVVFEHLADFEALLLKVPKYELPTQFGVLSPPLGAVRMKVVELLVAVLRSNYPPVYERISELELIPRCLGLFFEYPWNNLLHGLVEHVIQMILSGDSIPLKTTLFKRADVVGKLLEAHRQNDAQTRYRLGFMGHITRISNTIVNQALSDELLEKFCNESDEWNLYTNGKLSIENEKLNIQLGGHRPNGSFIEDSEDEMYDAGTFEEQAAAAAAMASEIAQKDAEQGDGSEPIDISGHDIPPSPFSGEWNGLDESAGPLGDSDDWANFDQVDFDAETGVPAREAADGDDMGSDQRAMDALDQKLSKLSVDDLNDDDVISAFVQMQREEMAAQSKRQTAPETPAPEIPEVESTDVNVFEAETGKSDEKDSAAMDQSPTDAKHQIVEEKCLNTTSLPQSEAVISTESSATGDEPCPDTTESEEMKKSDLPEDLSRPDKPEDTVPSE